MSGLTKMTKMASFSFIVFLLVTLTVISQGLANFSRTRIIPNHPFYYRPPPTEKPPLYGPSIGKTPGYVSIVPQPSPINRTPIYKTPVEKPHAYKPPVEKPPIHYKQRVGKQPPYNPPIESPLIYKP
ncbi:unnamed protein product [Trifolium pratense]|uniref:Uncharacterized protein n=1 Tax=Trifolium pratense TaxID=57577 RepID=A0ACB0KDR5_TRIPR|nr:unnamed protein product [Trifolium pratense]